MATQYDWKSVVRSFCNTLVGVGITLVGADDEEETIHTDDVDKIVEWVCGVDYSSILVKTPDTPEGKTKQILIVLGNGPEEIAADYSSDSYIDKAVDAHYDKWERRKTPTITV